MDIDEIKSWATAQLAVAAEHVKQQVALNMRGTMKGSTDWIYPIPLMISRMRSRTRFAPRIPST